MLAKAITVSSDGRWCAAPNTCFSEPSWLRSKNQHMSGNVSSAVDLDPLLPPPLDLDHRPNTKNNELHMFMVVVLLRDHWRGALHPRALPLGVGTWSRAFYIPPLSLHLRGGVYFSSYLLFWTGSAAARWAVQDGILWLRDGSTSTSETPS
eukprot:9092888-Pyramimonas_sp.AAC.2